MNVYNLKTITINELKEDNTIKTQIKRLKNKNSLGSLLLVNNFNHKLNQLESFISFINNKNTNNLDYVKVNKKNNKLIMN